MKRVQLSVYVTPEIAERLRLASDVAVVPVGRHVGDMLESLIDSVEFVSTKMAEARRQPAEALNRVRAIDDALAIDLRGRAGAPSSTAMTGQAEPVAARPQRGRGRTATGSAIPPSNTGVTKTVLRGPGRE